MRFEALPFQSIIFPIQRTYCSIAMKNWMKIREKKAFTIKQE
jgi:hypothetical protein